MSFTLKSPTFDDLSSFVEIARQCDKEIMGETNFTEKQARSDWEAPRFNPSNDVRLAFDNSTGRVAGFQVVFATRPVPVRPYVWGWVHPDFRRRGIGEALHRWAIERASQVKDIVPPEARIVLENETSATLPGAAELYVKLGFKPERASYNMMIAMDEPPDVPILPEGFHLTNFSERPDLDFFVKARIEGFRDHRGFMDEPLAIWRARWEKAIADQPRFDPTLLIMAMDGDQPAGMMWGNMDNDVFPDAGWISSVTTLPAYRKRGLALALLKHSFGQFYQRGFRKVWLSVDGSSLTGAVRLYERAGMFINRQYNIYEYEIRPGIELTQQG